MSHAKTCTILFVLLSFLWVRVARSELVDLAYSYSKEKRGGVATIQVDTETGRIVSQSILFQTDECESPNKLRRTEDRQRLIVTNEQSKGPHLFFANAKNGHGFQTLKLPAMPDELRVAGRYGVATCDDDWIALVNLDGRNVAGKWNAGHLFTPPGNKPEDAVVVAGGEYLVMSFQKDSKKGKKFGSRLAVFRLPTMQLLADLRLPRNRPELHIDGNLKEQGPSPEIVLVSLKSNTLVATLDLYGAILVADWSAAKTGVLHNWKYLPASLDGSWGTAFPDRASLFQFGGTPYVMSFNAGRDGGSVLIDLAGRKVAWRGRTPPGLEKPVYLEGRRTVYSVCSGKTKRRERKETTKSYHPRKSVYVFSLLNSAGQTHVRLQEIPLDVYAIRLAAVGESDPIIVIAGGGSKDPDTILTFDPETESIVDRRRAAGTIAQFEAR